MVQRSWSKKTLKRDGEVVDTNFLVWLTTMREVNEIVMKSGLER